MRRFLVLWQFATPCSTYARERTRTLPILQSSMAMPGGNGGVPSAGRPPGEAHYGEPGEAPPGYVVANAAVTR